jgi:hypothetical protein
MTITPGITRRLSPRLSNIVPNMVRGSFPVMPFIHSVFHTVHRSFYKRLPWVTKEQIRVELWIAMALDSPGPITYHSALSER